MAEIILPKLEEAQLKKLLEQEVFLKDVRVFHYRNPNDTIQDITNNDWKAGLFVFNGDKSKLLNIQTGEYLTEEIFSLMHENDGFNYSFQQMQNPHCDSSPFGFKGKEAKASNLQYEINALLIGEPTHVLPLSGDLKKILNSRSDFGKKLVEDYNLDTIPNSWNTAGCNIAETNKITLSKALEIYDKIVPTTEKVEEKPQIKETKLDF